MEADLLNKKIELIQWLSTLENVSTIKKVLRLKEKDQSDWSDEISVTEQESIKKGISDAAAGKLNNHAKARKVYEKWL